MLLIYMYQHSSTPELNLSYQSVNKRSWLYSEGIWNPEAEYNYKCLLFWYFTAVTSGNSVYGYPVGFRDGGGGGFLMELPRGK